MNINKICIPSILLIFVIVCSMSSNLVAQQKQVQSITTQPIIDGNVFSDITLYLRRFDHHFTEWSEFDDDIMNYYQKSGIDINKFKASKIEECKENWYSLPSKQMDNIKASRLYSTKEATNIQAYWCVSIERCYLKSSEGAIEWAKTIIIDHAFKDGSNYNIKVGDKCWISESRDIILFVKGSVFVNISVHKTRNKPGSGADKVITLAKIVESRL